MTFTIGMFGLSPFTDANSIDLDVKTGATLGDIVKAMGKKMPSLVGRVIESGRPRLVENYGFYVNGQFVSDQEDLPLKEGDNIVLILLATGG